MEKEITTPTIIVVNDDDGGWDWNLITNRVYFSRQWKSMFGYDIKMYKIALSGYGHL